MKTLFKKLLKVKELNNNFDVKNAWNATFLRALNYKTYPGSVTGSGHFRKAGSAFGPT